MDQPPAPTVVELHGGEHSPATLYQAEPHHPTKTFAELQQILIRNEALGVRKRRLVQGSIPVTWSVSSSSATGATTCESRANEDGHGWE